MMIGRMLFISHRRKIIIRSIMHALPSFIKHDTRMACDYSSLELATEKSFRDNGPSISTVKVAEETNKRGCHSHCSGSLFLWRD
jgi:beta-lactamase regulating signal transducer with metallopeptidase domain